MKQFVNDFVIKRMGRFRACALFLLLTTAGCMLFVHGAAPRTAPVEAQSKHNSALAGFVVAIDPGHGGYDGGARARESGLWEKVLTLRTSLAVEKALLEHGASIVLTRREDICLCAGNTATLARKRRDLQKRVDIAIAAKADVFLSIHMNEYRNRKECGPQVFYQRGGDAGRLLAGVLQDSLVCVLNPPKKRVAMAGNYYVLRSVLPSALVECGFLSNPAEEKLLLEDAYQQKIGEALAQGLIEYRQLLERMEAKTPS
ncbi:MAG: N-acetylmuramoyl-L-alanine amidase [Clostridia bacterium]